MRAAVIGAGFGAVHVKWLAGCPSVDLTAIGYHRDRTRAQALADQYGVREVSGDCPELAARGDLDLVVIASPPHTHHDLALPALCRSAVVVTDKPLAHSVPAARDLVLLARTRQARTMVTFQWRQHRGFQLLRDRLATGDLGEPLLFDLAFHHDFLAVGTVTAWPWRHDSRVAGGGALADLGVHVFDLLRWTTGLTWTVTAASTVLAATSRTSTSGPVACDTDDAAVVLLKATGSAAIARILVSRATIGTRRFEVTAAGSLATIRVSADPSDGSAVFFQRRPNEPTDARSFAPSTLNPYRQLLLDVQTGESSVADYDDGLAAQLLMHQAIGLAGPPRRHTGSDPPAPASTPRSAAHDTGKRKRS